MNKFSVVFLGLVASFSASSKTMDVGLVDQGRPPYFTKPTAYSPASGMYIDILNEIGKQTGIEFNYKFLPQKRIRAYMKTGLIDLEPGIDPSWRVSEGEMEASLYSDVLFYSQEVLVYNPDKFPNQPNHQELMTHEACKVLGFSDMDGNKAKSKFLNSEEKIVDLIKLGRCDWAIFPVDVINSSSHFEGLARTAPIATYELALRLHKSNAEYADDINKAISLMRKNGKLATIIDSYIEG